jgi:hypothetical protein
LLLKEVGLAGDGECTLWRSQLVGGVLLHQHNVIVACVARERALVRLAVFATTVVAPRGQP